MTARIFASFATILITLTACESIRSLPGLLQAQGLTQETIVAGLKESLNTGTSQAVNKLSVQGGYENNPKLRIPIPHQLEKFSALLRSLGLNSQVDAFEAKMNQAAERAAQDAAPVFVQAIGQMTFEDARQILKGHDTAATEYFKEKTSRHLRTLYVPIVNQEMQAVGAVSLYQDLKNRYDAIPLVPQLNFSIDQYVTDQALEGLFRVIANVEKDIRTNPAARTTALLKRVFGS